MIKVVRLPKPDVLARNQAIWTKALLDAKTQAERKKAESEYRHPEIKNTLIAMFHGKCAYCESRITHIAYGDIEHFRPKAKAKFPECTFEWTNLLLSCSVCNGAEHKGDRFPEKNEGGPLVNPCDDDPCRHFRFVFDPVTKLATVTGQTARGRTTEKLLGLNRAELWERRSRMVKMISVLASYAKTDSEAAALLEEASRDEAEYAAFVRVIKRKLQ